MKKKRKRPVYKTPRFSFRPPQSEETKRKIGLANKGKKRTPEQIQYMKACRRPYVFTKAHKKKLSDAMKGKRSRGWKGGKIVDTNGYYLIYKPDYIGSQKKGYVLEHRYMLANYLKRILNPAEQAHHINNDKLDNRIENLMLFKNAGYHNAFHRYGHCSPTGILFDGRVLAFENTKQIS